MSPVYQGRTCVPTITALNGTCTLGGFPSYVVNVTTVKQIQLAVNFARNTGLRLVIKNTGHDFLGKSGGAGALSIWTHYLNSIQYLPNFIDDVMSYSGPAFRVESGAITRDLYQAAEDHSLLLVGGEGVDVGIFGGYIQGGGHSPMSLVYGTAADQVLEMSTVTADGNFVTASSTNNTDLFWALRGGGATPVTQVYFAFTSSSNTTFWLGVRVYWKNFITLADAGTYSYFFIFPPSSQSTFVLQSFWAPNKTSDETAALLKPWLDDLAALNISVSPSYTIFPSPYPAIIAAFPQEVVVPVEAILDSRLFSRSSWEDPASFNATFDAWLSSSIDVGNLLIGFNIRAPNV
ncbi:FAD-linked oxidoreductase ZEB1 [Lachnellula suecica]|uniref:FAD-linked oxidoreductase ZEB1 n=1 Tax=Lachnellula suecica TaxID=602035 RepID=A0A8T9CAP6_9HELO|nr:FAD-linked oxidoreductase ZEB1 [Lachnellula suecica]